MEPREPDEPRVPTRLVVGLGNPGARYAMTRHNAGFMVADVLAMRCRVEITDRSGRSVVTRVPIEGADAWLAKPLCFMNRSGPAVMELLANCGDADAGILIVYDDFHLPLGKIRFRARGSAGGQNGVESIIQTLGREDFHRLRVGIGEPSPYEDTAQYVLSPIPPGERDAMRNAIEIASEAAEHWLRTGDIQGCMNRYN